MQPIANSEQTIFKQIEQLLSPSWLSGLVAVVGTLAVVIAGILATTLKGSTLQQAIYTTQNSSAITYQQLTSKFITNNFISNLPLLLFWLSVGFIVYFFANSIYTAVHEAVELREQIGYVNASRQSLIRQAMIHLIIRVVSLVVWFIYIKLFLQKLLPYVFATMHKVALAPGQIHNLEVAVLASLGLLIGWQLHATFIRLVLLRARVFS